MINLMPPEIKSSIKYGSYNVSLIQYISLIVITGLALVGIIIFGVQIVRSDAAKLNSSIATKKEQKSAYEQDVLKAEALIKKIQTVSALMDNEVKFSIIIQEIGRLIPPGAALNGLHLTSDLDQTLELQARAVSKHAITELQQNLINSDLFTGADIQEIQFDKDAPTYKYAVRMIVAFDKEKVKSL